MATPLSQNEQVAQAMLLYHTKAPAEALNIAGAMSAAVANVINNDPDPSDDEINTATLTAIQGLGYVTDLDSISSQYNYLKSSHAGFWAGNYTIVDSTGGVHSLLINTTDTRLLLNGVDEVLKVPSEGGGFVGQKLAVDNDKVTLAFSFSTTVDGIDLAADSTDLDDLAKRYAIVLSGTLTVKADSLGVRNIQGRRGVSTPAGVFHEYGEEPPWIWVGEYQVRYTDTALWEYHPGALVVAYDTAAKTLSVRLGSLQGTAVFYRNSVICFLLELTHGVSTQVTMAMLATSGGSRRCYLWFETTGQIRTLTGYALDRLDSAALWRGAGISTPPPVVPAAKTAVKTTALQGLAAETASFCQTPYDLAFSAADLITKTGTAGNKAISSLFKSDTLKISGSKVAVTGYRVAEIDASSNPTGRVVMFTCDESIHEAYSFPAGATLKAYQRFDEAGQPQAGLSHVMVGVLAPKPFSLPDMVEADFYNLRMSLTDYADISANGLSIGFAIDDAKQPGLIALVQPTAADAQCPYDANAGSGQDPSASPQIADYTRASVLVRGAKAGLLQKGLNSYYFSVCPKSTAGFFNVTRTLYKPSSISGVFDQDGVPSLVSVPVLMGVPIRVDDCNAFNLTNASWADAVPGKHYEANLRADGGVQPFTWRILNTSGSLPAGVDYASYNDDSGATAVPKVGSDFGANGLVNVGVTGNVSADAPPGSTFSLTVRAMGNKNSVMKPALARPMIKVGTPDTESKTPAEVAVWKECVIAASAALAIILAFVIYKKTRPADDKNKAAGGVDKLITDADGAVAKSGENTVGDLGDKSKAASNEAGRTDSLNNRMRDHYRAIARDRDRIVELERQRDETKNPFEKMQLEEQINRLNEEVDRHTAEANGEHSQVDKDGERKEARERK